MTYPTSRAGRLLRDKRRAKARNHGLAQRHDYMTRVYPLWVRADLFSDLPQPVPQSLPQP